MERAQSLGFRSVSQYIYFDWHKIWTSRSPLRPSIVIADANKPCQ